MKITKKSKIEYIKHQLSSDRNWMNKGLIKIYQQQTLAERESEQTMFKNGAGFDLVDDKKFSRVAKLLIRGMSIPDMCYREISNRLPRYASQLYSMSNEEILINGYLKYKEEQDKLESMNKKYVQPSLDLGLSESYNFKS